MVMKTIFRAAVGGVLVVAGVAALVCGAIKRDLPLIRY